MSKNDTRLGSPFVRQFIEDCYEVIATNQARLAEILRKPQGQWTDEEARIVAAHQQSLSPLNGADHD